jgi:hypothetical protein
VAESVIPQQVPPSRYNMYNTPEFYSFTSLRNVGTDVSEEPVAPNLKLHYVIVHSSTLLCRTKYETYIKLCRLKLHLVALKYFFRKQKLTLFNIKNQYVSIADYILEPEVLLKRGSVSKKDTY